MKKIALCAALILLINQFANAGEIRWKQAKGTHFIVYYTRNQQGFAREVLYRAEKDYVRIARSFGYNRYSDFWTWDNRVKIYIYPDKASYVKATAMPAWSGGMAEYTQKYIASYKNSDEFLELVLPHEMAHLIFRDFVGFKGQVPLWLDEGVAQWAEVARRDHAKETMLAHKQKGILFSLKDMMNIDIRTVNKNNTITVEGVVGDQERPRRLTLKGGTLVKLYYTQAASVVALLIERFGIERFATFCRALRDGATLDKALKDAYTGKIVDITELQAVWLESLESN